MDWFLKRLYEKDAWRRRVDCNERAGASIDNDSDSDDELGRSKKREESVICGI